MEISKLTQAADGLCQDLDQGIFVPLLEADIAAYLYHRLVLAEVPIPTIHLDTRIIGIPQFKYDLVIGSVKLDSEAERAAVNYPQLVVQIKLFPQWGFTHQQHRVHYRHVVEDDIASFRLLRANFPNCKCCELLADSHRGDLHGYLRGQDRSAQSTRIDRVCKLAAKAGISVDWLHPANQTKTVSKWWSAE